MKFIIIILNEIIEITIKLFVVNKMSLNLIKLTFKTIFQIRLKMPE